MKTLKRLLKQNKNVFFIPKTVQQTIPINKIWEDGIFLVDNFYSKSFKFDDINYSVASNDEKESIFLKYSAILNSFDSSATTKITINNQKTCVENFEKDILMQTKNDELDIYRKEYNNMLIDKSTGANSIKQEKYITISIIKKNIEEARSYFARATTELANLFSSLNAKIYELNAEDRLKIFHNFLVDNKDNAVFNYNDSVKKGHSFKDYLSPASMEYKKDFFKLGNKYGCVLFLKDYANFISDKIISDLCDINNNIMLSIDIVPIPTDEAVKEAESRLMGVEKNILERMRKYSENGNFSMQVPYDMEKQKAALHEYLDDLTTRDQRMMVSILTIVHTADTENELNNNTERLLMTARSDLCQLDILSFQQLDGLNTALPYGVRKIDALRTLTTEASAVFMPFKTQEICHKNGNYYGLNTISKNLIIINRKELINGNSFILGVPGGGKSFAAKEEIVSIMLNSNSDVIIIDPEREYNLLTKAIGGEVIDISASSKNHINSMDINANYGDDQDPVIVKADFVMTLCEQIVGENNLGSQDRSIIDRCTALIYKNYVKKGFTGKAPTLLSLKNELLKQPEPEAKKIALALELFTDGSLNTFSKTTNVDTNNRLICFDILDLGSQLMPIGMLVILDNILNRISKNRAEGKNTFIFIDEIYLLFKHKYSAEFLEKLWKRVRKYGAYAIGITQNVEDLLKSSTAQTMLSNSDFIIMLNQAATDRQKLANLLKISEDELLYITNVTAGKGLLKVGSSLIPFENEFPKDTKLYELMTTKLDEIQNSKNNKQKNRFKLF